MNYRINIHIPYLLIALAAVLSNDCRAAAKTDAQTFATPEDAVTALAGAALAKDRAALRRIFGSASHDLLWSGDQVEDRATLERAANVMQEKRHLKKKDENTMVLVMGSRNWPFPIPLVKGKNGWAFDTAAGKEEMLNRRIGENEIKAIRAMRGIVQAERLYVLKDYDGDGFNEYAQVFRSEPGKKNGLFWLAGPGEEQSPLGALAAEAAAEGYKSKKEGRTPYHGYFFKILTRQGSRAPGGAKSYFTAGGRMTEGFAVLAWPAGWNVSGVMTFLADQNGAVLEKDLGPDSAKIAEKMQEYAPDEGWQKVQG